VVEVVGVEVVVVVVAVMVMVAHCHHLAGLGGEACQHGHLPSCPGCHFLLLQSLA
jgi:hypothetical protein